MGRRWYCLVQSKPIPSLCFWLAIELMYPALQVHEITPKTDGGKTISYPTDNLTQFEFKLPQALPTGEYLVRVEHIALQDAARLGGAQFYVSTLSFVFGSMLMSFLSRFHVARSTSLEEGAGSLDLSSRFQVSSTIAQIC